MVGPYLHKDLRNSSGAFFPSFAEELEVLCASGIVSKVDANSMILHGWMPGSDSIPPMKKPSFSFSSHAYGGPGKGCLIFEYMWYPQTRPLNIVIFCFYSGLF